ncbi:hypothetical protein [uncultured Psychroserpens sp.]|uniref:hypothetical protein n=1 Tax=uncultured Psychroserpens sp. TaxID=255436 RepID=UPI002623AE84|nr:hypothetical protein [uncultured Psychroserpens sp.]
MKNIIKICLIVFTLSIVFTNCREEKTPEEKVEAALNDVGEDLEDAADDVKDAAEDLKDEIEEVKEESGDNQ